MTLPAFAAAPLLLSTGAWRRSISPAGGAIGSKVSKPAAGRYCC